jgi:hypothetical protein
MAGGSPMAGGAPTSGGAAGGTTVDAGAGLLLGPTPYRQLADSPFADAGLSLFMLEDMEDGAFSLAPVSMDGLRTTLYSTTLVDSVDGDDGNPTDGQCWRPATPCESLFSPSGPAGITIDFRFTPGGMPTHAGLVWTDGEGSVSFEAFDSTGQRIGLIGPFSGNGFPDLTVANTTAEDRFFGAVSPSGISRIRVFNTLGGVEIDHVQYGR